METDTSLDEPQSLSDDEFEEEEEDLHSGAVDRAAAIGPDDDAAKALSPVDQDLAMEWFMGDTPDVVATRTFELNVGRYDAETGEWEEFFIPWTVQAIGRDRIRQIRRASQPRRRRRGQQAEVGAEDDLKANEMIATEGTVHPDLRAAAQNQGIANPAIILRAKMAHKPGLIDQIAGEVLSASGYDDEDVREVVAAKNS